MKLICSIEPNGDGIVIAEFGETQYTFAADENGDLVADVANESHLSHLLETGNFYPFDESDFQAASDILNAEDDGEEEAAKPKRKRQAS